ncbi:MAG: AAA family ATPase [Candidatus Omnitrophica bacterium]|nr:AAA family ATPase [Candidatus Omnitrophota bacterium]
MKTISIANQKGGCGKTTTAINLSSAIALSGKRVLLIDLDPQSHATYGLGLTNQTTDKSAYNILTDNSQRRRAIADCILPVCQNLDLIPSTILLSTIEQELKDKEDAVSKLYDILSSKPLDYDYVIIDCPPSLGFLTFNALRAADLVLVPIDMSAFSLMGVAKLLGMLELIKVKISHSPRVNALATIFDRRTKYSQQMFDEIKSLFKEQMLETIIRLNVTLKKAASKGVSVMQFDDKSNGAIDYMALAKELLAHEDKDEEVEKAIMTITETIHAPQPVNRISEERQPEVESLSEILSKEITFAINAPDAKDIHIVGDFNHWKINEESRLARIQDGRWEKRVGLSPGKYKYKFVIDGEWVLDSQNTERVPNAFGSFDSIINL